MNIENQKEIKIKILTLGDFAVGKTSFITKFIDNKFSEVYLSTIGVDFKFKTQVLPNGKKVKIQFIDTAGQERFHSIAYNMIKHADGILLIYDITRKETFDNVSNWIENIRENKISNFPIILIGNKSDLENERQVTKEEGEAKSKELGLLFFETSNKDGINIEETTIELINKIFEKNEIDIHINQNENKIKEKEKKKKNGRFKLFRLFKLRRKSKKKKN